MSGTRVIRDPYRLLRSLLFRLDAERAHELTIRLGGLAQRSPRLLAALGGPPPPGLACFLGPLRLASPVGLAAGLDKGGRLLRLWQALGFGFVEVGTVTPRPQAGNPRPRLYRIPSERLILNRMGFNSEGADVVARRLEHRPAGLVVGGNVGRNRATPDADAPADYARAYERLAPHVDYAVLNVSSPNTPGLRHLQAPDSLARLLDAATAVRRRLGLEHQPLFVKLAPDIDERDLGPIVERALAEGADGIVATNTTVDRRLVPLRARAQVEAWGEGGISGAPLAERAAHVRRVVSAALDGRGALVACGGIGSPEAARAALADGAAAIQVYSGIVFEGPGLARRINDALASSS
jgi:dihydroorotate dehydrogenase